MPKVPSPFAQTFYLHDNDTDQMTWYGIFKPLPASLSSDELLDALKTQNVRVEEENRLQSGSSKSPAAATSSSGSHSARGIRTDNS